MRKILAAGVVIIAGAAVYSLWGAGMERYASGASSQIFIHGTPVCVTQRAGGIEAVVGECDTDSVRSPGGGEWFHGRNESPDSPGLGLPPGHPPVGPDSDPFSAEVRSTPI